MRTTTLAMSLLASVAFATPLFDKRYMVTSIVMETATVTVTGSRGGWWNWGRPTYTPTATNTVSIITSSVNTLASTPTSSETVLSSTSDVPLPTVSEVSTSSTSSTAPTTTTATTNQPTGSVSAYAAPILKQHNLHRANHSAPDLQWDDRLANIAQEIASSCQYAHNTQAGGGGYGQNIGAGAPDDEIDQMITNQMYNDEMMLYPAYGTEPDMSNFERWGHFSQIVWKSTTSVGCYTQHCTGGLGGVGSNVSPYFTVCNYAGPGNFGGQYADNVLQPRGDAIISL